MVVVIELSQTNNIQTIIRKHSFRTDTHIVIVTTALLLSPKLLKIVLTHLLIQRQRDDCIKEQTELHQIARRYLVHPLCVKYNSQQ